jgi:hypothetical protein
MTESKSLLEFTQEKYGNFKKFLAQEPSLQSPGMAVQLGMIHKMDYTGFLVMLKQQTGCDPATVEQYAEKLCAEVGLVKAMIPLDVQDKLRRYFGLFSKVAASLT